MVRFKPNIRLIILAAIGLLLYFGVNVLYTLQGGENPDEMTAKPSVTEEAAGKAALEWFVLRYPGSSAEVREILYESDKTMSAYVQKNELAEEYEKRFSGKYPLDYWLVEVAENERNVQVRVGMEKPSVFAWREIGAVVQRDHRSEAERALTEAGYRPADFDYRPVPGAEDEHRFVSTRHRIGEAPLTIQVETSPAGIVTFIPGFEPPDAFVDWVEKQDSGAMAMSLISLILSGAMAIAALIFVIIKRRQAWFSRGIVFALVTLAVSLVSVYNSLRAQMAGAEAGENMDGTQTFMLVFSIILYGLMAVSLYLQAVAGDQLWRERNWYPWFRWRDPGFGRHVFYSMGRGYLLCLFIMGVQQLLFLFAENSFDAFAVNDPTQSIYNMNWPWLLPLMAWMAGISEEITYRLFGIVLFRKMVRVRFLSVLLPSIIWALGHTGYAIYPNYTRLFEVAVLGIVFGYIFLRYGLYTAIFAHVIMDSILMSVALMTEEGTTGSILIGLFYIALPFLVALAILMLHRLLWKDRPDPGIRPEPSPYPYPPGPRP